MSFVYFDEKRSIRHRFISPSWGLMRCAASFFLILFLCIMPVSAAEPEDTSEEVTLDVQTVQEIHQVIEYELQLSEPITTIQITEEDYNNQTVPYLEGSAYQGSFNSTALNYFTGVMLNNVGMDYVAFRGSQYMYYLYFGDDISYSGVFTGSSLNYVSYNAQYGTISRGVDNLDIDPNATIVYSNVDNSFANLVEVKTVEETRSQGIITASIFILLCILWFFKR